MLSTCCLCPLRGLPWFPPLLVSPLQPLSLMPSLPKECLFCFSTLPLRDRCLLCVWKSIRHAVGMNRQALKIWHRDCSKVGTEQQQGGGPRMGRSKTAEKHRILKASNDQECHSKAHLLTPGSLSVSYKLMQLVTESCKISR